MIFVHHACKMFYLIPWGHDHSWVFKCTIFSLCDSSKCVGILQHIIHVLPGSFASSHRISCGIPFIGQLAFVYCIPVCDGLKRSARYVDKVLSFILRRDDSREISAGRSENWNNIACCFLSESTFPWGTEIFGCFENSFVCWLDGSNNDLIIRREPFLERRDKKKFYLFEKRRQSMLFNSYSIRRSVY